MKKIMKVIFALIPILQYSHSQVSTQDSPCSHVFTYETSTYSDRWYGNIKIRPEVMLYGFWIDVILDRTAERIENDMGDVSTMDYTEFKIENQRLRLNAYRTMTLRILVKYNPRQSIPRIKTIRFNGQEICTTVRNPTTQNNYETTSRIEAFSLNDRNEGSLHNPQQPNQRAPTISQNGISSVNDRQNNRSTTIAGTTGTHYDENPSNINTYSNTRNVDNRRQSTQRDASTQVTETTTRIIYSSLDSSRKNDDPQFDGSDFNSRTNNNERTNIRPLFQDNPSYSSNTNTRKPPRTTTVRYNYDSKDYEFPEPSKKNKDTANDYFEGDFGLSGSKIRPTPLPRRRQDNDGSNTNTRGSDNKCGKVSAQPRPLIVGGQTANEGQWPWHVALYQTQTVDNKYICGGSLVTASHVLTAAHCVTLRSSSRIVNPQTLTVYLGKYNLRKSTDSVQIMLVRHIDVHPQYNSSNFYADLAVLKFTKPSEYTLYVRPICLWKKSEKDLSFIIDKEGIVVGWGFDEDGEVTEELALVRMPVVKQSTCLWSFKEFYTHFTSEQSYCAGYENGTSVCNGDSGGGMVFSNADRDNSVTWRLRGLVSIGVAKQYEYKCDPYHYVVFTDTAQFLDWIEEKIST